MNASTHERNLVELISGISPRETRIRKASIEQVNAAPFYAISYDMKVEGRRSTGIYEIDCDSMSHDEIVRDIADGQYENIDRIFHSTPGGLCEDVTHDMAVDVEAVLIRDQGSDYREHCMAKWIENHLGGLQAFDLMDIHDETVSKVREWVEGA